MNPLVFAVDYTRLRRPMPNRELVNEFGLLILNENGETILV